MSKWSIGLASASNTHKRTQARGLTHSSVCKWLNQWFLRSRRLCFSPTENGTFPWRRAVFLEREARYLSRNAFSLGEKHKNASTNSPRLAPGAPRNPTRPPTSCVTPATLPNAASGTNPGKLCIKPIEKRRFHCAPLCSQVAVSQSKPSIGNGRRRWNCILVRAPCVIASLPGSPLELRSHYPTVRRKHREQ